MTKFNHKLNKGCNSLKAALLQITALFFHVLDSTVKSVIKGRKALPMRKVSWIKPTEFKRYVIVVAWITNTNHLKQHYLLLIERILKLSKNCSFNWAFAYMKEVLRLTTRALAGSPEVNTYGVIRVKRDRFGLPTIIPLWLRYLLIQFIENNGHMETQKARKAVIAILTLLAIFRIFPTKVKPSLETITAPFTGRAKTLSPEMVKEALQSILRNADGRKLRVTIRTFQPHVSSKAGPNGPFNT